MTEPPQPSSGRGSKKTEQEAKERKRREEERIDESLEQTFPASDPPAWMGSPP